MKLNLMREVHWTPELETWRVTGFESLDQALHFKHIFEARTVLNWPRVDVYERDGTPIAFCLITKKLLEHKTDIS